MFFYLFFLAMLALFFIGVALILRGGWENYLGAAVSFGGAMVAYILA